MKNILSTSTFAVITFLFLISCSDDEALEPLGKYETGILISNEGNFTDADGSVSFLNSITEEVKLKIFETENSRPFGGLLQSIGQYEDYAYLIDNLGNKIEIVDINTFESTMTFLEGLSLPRYFVAGSKYAFISNWGPYADDFSSPESFLAVLNLDENTLDEKIEGLPSRPEGMIISADRLFVSSQASNLVTVFDASSREKLTTIEVGFGSSHFVEDSNGILWVTCTEGKVYAIDPVQLRVVNEVSIESVSGKLAIDNSGENLYIMTSEWAPDFSFTQNLVVKMPVASPSNQEIIYSSQNLYGIGVNPINGLIYLANSNAFLGNGTIIVIDDAGIEIDNFPSGRAPNGFVFR